METVPCEMCGELLLGSSHYHCPNCGKKCSMMGHYDMQKRDYWCEKSDEPKVVAMREKNAAPLTPEPSTPIPPEALAKMPWEWWEHIDQSAYDACYEHGAGRYKAAEILAKALAQVPGLLAPAITPEQLAAIDSALAEPSQLPPMPEISSGSPDRVETFKIGSESPAVPVAEAGEEEFEAWWDEEDMQKALTIAGLKRVAAMVWNASRARLRELAAERREAYQRAAATGSTADVRRMEEIEDEVFRILLTDKVKP